MSVKCHAIIEAMDKLAPRHLAESWDNVGLLLGSPDQAVSNILVALDVTSAIAEKARRDGVDLIIAHHPLIFKALTGIRTDLQPGKTIAILLKNDIALFAAHTNLDTAPGGVNDILASRLGLVDSRPLSPDHPEKLLKLAVFVPESHVEEVRQAIAAAGAGHIGNYSHCTFQTAGTGTFLPLDGTNPFIGKPGKLEYAPEFRLETVLPEAVSGRVISAMLKAHPYEEVAYDIYALENPAIIHGLGRVGRLAESTALTDFVDAIKKALAIQQVRVAGAIARTVCTVAVCGGAGGSLVRKAAAAGADVLVTGDVKYHEAQEARELGLVVIDAGHFATEQPVVEAVAAYLRQCADAQGWTVTINADTGSEDIFSVY